MIPQTLLAEATRYGIQLYADGQTISYRGPKSTVAELKPKFAAQKSKVLALLRAECEEAKISRLSIENDRIPLPAGGHFAYSLLASMPGLWRRDPDRRTDGRVSAGEKIPQ